MDNWEHIQALTWCAILSVICVIPYLSCGLQWDTPWRCSTGFASPLHAYFLQFLRNVWSGLVVEAAENDSSEKKPNPEIIPQSLRGTWIHRVCVYIPSEHDWHSHWKVAFIVSFPIRIVNFYSYISLRECIYIYLYVHKCIYIYI